MAAAYRLARSQQAASVHVLNNELAHAHLRVGDLHHFLHRFLSQWTYVSLFSAVHGASQIGSSVLHTSPAYPTDTQTTLRAIYVAKARLTHP